ncbi:MAG: hypothetical protein ACFFEY_02760 [Candidatus Thorarchaeota archaeon]
MKTTTFETLTNSKIFMQLKNELSSESIVKNFEDLLKMFERFSVDFATVDLGFMSLREFNETYLSKILREYEIPYFTIELPHYVKGYLVNQIDDIKNKYNEIKSTYDILTNKDTPTARELIYLMNYYSNEIRELKSYINQKIRTNLVVKKILNVIKGREVKDWNLIHFGKKGTFKEINSQLKKRNIESKVLIVDL